MTKRVVIDASIIVNAYTCANDTEDFKLALALIEQIKSGDIVGAVPEHFNIECASVISKYQRRNKTEITQANALKFLEFLEFANVVPAQELRH